MWDKQGEDVSHLYSFGSKPSAYDKIQNQWAYVTVAAWAVSVIVAIATTADVVGGALRKEINDLRERVVAMETMIEGRR
mgnify:CR=1 FL=1